MSKRHEEEIREVLNGLDRFLPDEPGRADRSTLRAVSRPPRQVDWLKKSEVLAPERMMLLGLVLCIAGYFASRSLALQMPALGLLGLMLLLTGYGLSLARARRRPPETRWRGRVVRLSPRQQTLGQVVRCRWWELRTSLRRWLGLP